jgi:transcriptional regulator GlxA family with amidase domain
MRLLPRDKEDPVKKTIAVLVFPDAELLDFAGPLELLSYATGVDGGECFTVGPQREAVTSPPLKVTVDYLFDDAPVADVIVVPGGSGASEPYPHTEAVVAYIQSAARRGALIASVCTGTFLLGRAGLLDGRDCTTHHQGRARLARDFPAARVHAATVVADGLDLVTAANVSSGIDLSLYLLERFYGMKLADGMAKLINFAPRRDEIVEFGMSQPVA